MAIRVVPQTLESADRSGRLGSEWTAVLADVPLFSGLSRRHLGHVVKIARLKRFPRGTKIVTAGEPGDAFYVIVDGSASMRLGGRRVSFGEGQFFGEMALLDGSPRSATVTADSDLAAVVIPRKAFLKLLNSEPKITIGLLEVLTQRLRALSAAGSL